MKIKFWTLYKLLFPPKTTILNLVLEVPTKLPPSLGQYPVHRVTNGFEGYAPHDRFT